MKLEDVKNSPLSSGKREMIKHLEGKPLTRKQAMSAKCFECCNGFIDGRIDCEITDCPLYGFMPYAKN